MRKKSDLPTKVCPVCERPFAWRARWKNNWDEVVYCSRKCSSQRYKLKRGEESVGPVTD